MSFSKNVEKLFARLAELRGGSPREFAEEIRRIRFWLTEARDKRPSGYMNDPRAFSGYLSYHLPLHLPELFWILDRMGERDLVGNPPRSVLDVGCGPGTASLSLFLWLQSKGAPEPKELHLADISKRAIDTARELLSSVTDVRPTYHRVDKGKGVGLPNNVKADWILVSHVLNELGNGPRFREKKLLYLETLASKHLNPGGTIFVIEPPLREPTLDVNTLRDMWMDEYQGPGGTVVAPCAPGVARCPVLLQKRGWCYSQPPRTWARAKGLAPLDRELEKTLVIELTNPGFSYMVLRTDPDLRDEPSHEIAVTDSSMKPPMACTTKGLRAAPKLKYRGEWLEARKRKESPTRPS